MSMVNDIMGLGRSAYTESVELEPEIADMRLEDAEDLEEGTDLMEFMSQVAFECDMNMRNLEMAVIADEYNYLRENGEEMIYEDSRMQSFINKFKEITKKVWVQIQKFYKAAMKKVDAFLYDDKKFVEKYKKKASKNNGIYKGIPLADLGVAMNIVVDSMVGMSTYSGKIGEEMLVGTKAAEVSDGNAPSDPKTFRNAAKSTYNSNKSSSNNNSKSEDYSKLVKNARLSVFKDAFSQFGLKDGDGNAKDVYSSIIKTIKQRSKTMKISGATACKELLDLKKSRDKFKKAYDNSKKLINTHLKNAKKAETLAKKFKVVPTALSSTIHTVVKVLNTISKWCTQGNRCGLTIYNMQRGMLKAAVVSAASGPNNTDKLEKDTVKSYDAVAASALDLYEPGMEF